VPHPIEILFAYRYRKWSYLS